MHMLNTRQTIIPLQVALVYWLGQRGQPFYGNIFYFEKYKLYLNHVNINDNVAN